MSVAARRRCPRKRHADWSPARHRESPVEILAAQETHRILELVPLRRERMRASAFAFLRGAAAVMAADLRRLPHTGLTVQLCGDAHLANFGTFASPEGQPVFDVNDFDETFPGPFEWDVKRLAASLVVAARDQGAGARLCRSLVLSAVHAYRRQMHRMAGMAPLEAWLARVDMAAAVGDIDDGRLRRRLTRHLHAAAEAAETHFGLVQTDVEGAAGGSISDRGHTRHLAAYTQTIAAAFAAYPDTLQAQFAGLVRRYTLSDSAFKVVGVGSVGTFCAIGLFTAPHGALLLQLKEAQASVLAAPETPPINQGERVVAGQRLLQAEPDMFLGWIATAVDGRHFYVRRLKDARLADIGAQLEAGALPFAAALCGRTLARAHGRAGAAPAIAAYLGHGDSFDGAIADFAERYADQNALDYTEFVKATAPRAGC